MVRDIRRSIWKKIETNDKLINAVELRVVGWMKKSQTLSKYKTLFSIKVLADHANERESYLDLGINSIRSLWRFW